ncbi:MAG: hypothetical protein KatS3mg105_2879 [Gemmatales bacterium]|nr:MAG: hypothetical protein KatS3mg105_2879 [Gemmatales bacterium]
MRLLVTLTASVAILWPLSSIAGEELVKEIKIKGLTQLVSAKGSVTKPTTVKSREELVKVIRDKTARLRIESQVRFATDELLIFAWQGSSGDRLEAKVKGNQVEFIYSPGVTDDVRPLVRLFALKKGTKWEVKSRP